MGFGKEFLTMINPQLEGKVALITGANNPFGIGAATARAFAAHGSPVFVTYYRTPLPAETHSGGNVPGEALYREQQTLSADWLVNEIRGQGGAADALEVDLADAAAIPALFAAVEAKLGPVQILVNNAAYCVPDTFIAQLTAEDRAPDGFPVHSLTPQSHDLHFAVNSRGTALMMYEFARRHAQRGASWGRIVNVSTDGAPAFSGEISYGASKHALESYSRAAAKEFGRYGITVNVVSLGPIQTGWIAPELEALIEKDTPLGRVGMPQDAADVIVFLASEQARWLTGQLLYVGGGHAMPQ
jgi:3-oxoacyl-[acyl-carrier protein] reductase